MDKGWIKLHRKIMSWEWYQHTNTFRVFFHLLMNANYEDKLWHGITIKKGQVVTSRKSLQKALNISQQSIRTSLANIQSTNEITIKSTNKYSIITIVKYRDYQIIEEKSTNKLTNQLTTTKEDKEEKNIYIKKETTKNNKKTMKTINYDTQEEIKTTKYTKVTKQENNFIISVGLLWANLVKKELNLEDHELAISNVNTMIRNVYLKHKFTYNDFDFIFKDWLKKEKLENKQNFYFCLGEQNIAKYIIQKKEVDKEERIKNLRRG